MVLEPDERPRAIAEVALEQHVPDHARRARVRLEVEQAEAAQLVAVVAAVDVAEQLVAAAHGEQRRAVRDRACELGAVALQVVGDQQLVAILAAAEQEEVDLGGVELLRRTQRALHELDPAPCAALAQHEHVPAVGVDREVLGVELAEDELHAVRSQ